MKHSLTSVVIAICAVFGAQAQAPFDFASLDKLEARAKNRTNITLDGPLLKLAASFLGAGDDKDAAQIKALVGNLTWVYVRGFEFEKDGQYTDADLEALHASLRQAPWSRIVDVHEGSEVSEIWVARTPGSDKFAGVAIIDSEPRELTVVYISGVIGPEDIARLNGRFGINVDALDRKNKPANSGNGNKKKDQDQ
jgi:hypothetical protein